jgi:hypothetical protein
MRVAQEQVSLQDLLNPKPETPTPKPHSDEPL